METKTTMFENINDDERRGQVGIGTLIVFIAMVLVAAIAAGVLVNTAGFLQSTAEDTGEESVSQVTNRVGVVNAVGTYDSTNDVVDQVNLTIRKSPGSDDVDVNASTVSYLSEDTATTLTGGGSSAATASTFQIAAIKDDDDSLTVLNDKGDRFELVLNVSAIEGQGLDAGETVELKITTKTGDTTIYSFTMPDSYSGTPDNGPIGL